jgi:1,4-dihydroxy-2-naphthoate octaprenyltransferase
MLICISATSAGPLMWRNMARRILRLTRPLQLIFTAMMYVLGAGIARYLGAAIHWPAFWIGLLAVLLIQVAAYWLVETFRLPFAPLAAGETPRQRENFRVLLLQVSFAALTLFFVAVLTLFLTRSFNLPSGIFLALNFLILVAYAVPPLRLSETGYGELALAVSTAAFVPAASFLFHADEFHRILPLTSFPLSFLALACLLISDFPTFATDQKLERCTLLTRLGWQRAVPLHHMLVLAAFLLFASTPFFGIPWRMIWPVFLDLPFAAAQVIWLQRISRGGRTLWNFLVPLSAVVFGLAAYLLAFTFWTR